MCAATIPSFQSRRAKGEKKRVIILKEKGSGGVKCGEFVRRVRAGGGGVCHRSDERTETEG